MIDRRDRETLLLRYLDGALPEAEKSELEAWLRGDPAAREWLREIAEQAVAMGDLARMRGLPVPPVVKEERTRFTPVSWLALAAALMILGGLAALFLTRSTPGLPALVEVVEAEGPISWSGADAEWRHALTKGARLPSGTLQADGEAASAQIRFTDGSVIGLSGGVELSYSEQDRQKRLWLRRGSISAQVRPQPDGRPMLIRTTTAEVEVVGTAFSLCARPDDTLLTVDEGLVKLKRFTDGRVVDVPARNSVLAKLGDIEQLGASTTPGPLEAWRFDFTTTVPPVRWRGVWTSSPEGGRMVASPYVAGREPDGTATTHFGVSIRPAYLDPPLTLLAQAESVIRYRLKQSAPGSLQVMLFTAKLNGGYGGNFECRIPAEDLHADGDGWCEVLVSVRNFRPVSAKHPSPVGHIVSSVLVSSFTTDRRLTVSDFELRPSAP